MRTFVWIVWAGIVGAAVPLLGGPNIIDNTIWFFLIAGSFLIASWHGFNLVWPDRASTEVE